MEAWNNGAAAINDGESFARRLCRVRFGDFDSGQALLLSGDYSCKVAMPAGRRRTERDAMHGNSRRRKRSIAVGRGLVSVTLLPSAVGVDSMPPTLAPMALPVTLASSFGQARAHLAAPAAVNLCSTTCRFSELFTL